MGRKMILRPRVWLNLSTEGGGIPRRLRVSAAHDEWNHVGIALVAMEEGYFAEEGLKDVELISFEGTPGEVDDREARQIDLLARGAVDIAIDPKTSMVLEAKDRGSPVCIVAARRKTHAFVLVGEKGLRTPQDLRGKTIKMGHRGGATDVMMRQVLKDSGLEPDRDVEFSYVGGPMHDPRGVTQAFMEGKYGPAILAPAGEDRILIGSGYPVLADLRKLYPSRHDRVTAANEKFCSDHSETLKGYLKGMIEGCQFVLDVKNKERFKEILAKAGFLSSDREQRSFESLFDAWQERVSGDLLLPMDGIRLIVEEQKRAGKISPSFEVETILRLDELREAQHELGA